MKKKRAFITGIAGQDGSYLAETLLKKGYEVHGLLRRVAVEDYRERLSRLRGSRGKIRLHAGDVSDYPTVWRLIAAIKPDEVYHLAAQSFVGESFRDPISTMRINIDGTAYLLSAMKELHPSCRFYFAATSEMFGRVLTSPQNEKTPFNPVSPYGISKLASFHLVRMYREGYGLFAVSGILFNHECVTAETPVVIRRNRFVDIVPIEEIVPHRENPHSGTKYTTVCTNNLEVWDGGKWTKVKMMTATWNKAGGKGDKKVIRVVCRGGYYEATRDHVSFLDSGKEIPTGDLKSGHALTLKPLPDLPQRISLTEAEAEFLGMIVADGYISSEGKGRLINNDPALRKRIAILWGEIAGGVSREDKHPSGFQKGAFVSSVELSGNRPYLRFIHSEVYTQKLLKRVPRRILNADTLIISAFLRGYNACDGLKGGRQKTEFKSFTTNSPVLALGLWFLVDGALKLRITAHPEFRDDKLYFHLNMNSDMQGGKGKHLRRSLSEIKDIRKYDYTGWLFDLETESGTFSAGVGLTWMHNSPRRGLEFVTRKITHTAARIKLGLEKELRLGNLDAKRDWGFAGDYVEAMWMMLQQRTPRDYVIGTGEAHSVREFVEETFKRLGLDWKSM